VSLLRAIAAEAGEMVEPNGFYVPTGDADALRRAMQYLLDHAADRRALGEAGRRAVERFLTVDQFAERMSALVEQARAAHQLRSYTPRRVSYLRVTRNRSAAARV